MLGVPPPHMPRDGKKYHARPYFCNFFEACSRLALPQAVGRPVLCCVAWGQDSFGIPRAGWLLDLLPARGAKF